MRALSLFTHTQQHSRHEVASAQHSWHTLRSILSIKQEDAGGGAQGDHHLMTSFAAYHSDIGMPLTVAQGADIRSEHGRSVEATRGQAASRASLVDANPSDGGPVLPDPSCILHAVPNRLGLGQSMIGVGTFSNLSRCALACSKACVCLSRQLTCEWPSCYPIVAESFVSPRNMLVRDFMRPGYPSRLRDRGDSASTAASTAVSTAASTVSTASAPASSAASTAASSAAASTRSCIRHSDGQPCSHPKAKYYWPAHQNLYDLTKGVRHYCPFDGGTPSCQHAELLNNHFWIPQDRFYKCSDVVQLTPSAGWPCEVASDRACLTAGQLDKLGHGTSIHAGRVIGGLLGDSTPDA